MLVSNICLTVKSNAIYSEKVLKITSNQENVNKNHEMSQDREKFKTLTTPNVGKDMP